MQIALFAFAFMLSIELLWLLLFLAFAVLNAFSKITLKFFRFVVVAAGLNGVSGNVFELVGLCAVRRLFLDLFLLDNLVLVIVLGRLIFIRRVGEIGERVRELRPPRRRRALQTSRRFLESSRPCPCLP